MWDMVHKNEWEAATFKLIQHFLRGHAEAAYIDFGAWVIPTALYAAIFSDHVYALGVLVTALVAFAMTAVSPLGEMGRQDTNGLSAAERCQNLFSRREYVICDSSKLIQKAQSLFYSPH